MDVDEARFDARHRALLDEILSLRQQLARSAPAAGNGTGADGTAGVSRCRDVQVTPILGADGRPERLPPVSHDITESREAEQLRLAVEAAGMLCTWDCDLGSDRSRPDAILADVGAVDPARTARGATLGDHIRQLHPDDVQAFDAELDRLFAGARDFHSEHRLLRADGSVRWVLARGRMLRDMAGAPTRFVGASVDITDRRQAEIRQAFLLELSDQLRMLAQPTAILAAAATLLGRHLGAGQVGYGLVQPDDETILLVTGHADGVEPLAGRYPLAAFGAEAVSRQRLGLTVACDDIRSAPPCDFARGDDAHGAAVSVPLLRDGRFTAAFYVVHSRARAWSVPELTLIEDVAARSWDAAERAGAEAALREANAVLQQRVVDVLAKREQAEETLRQAQKMEAVDQLTGGLAHDFNNLLTGITGSLELLASRMAQGRTTDLDRYIEAALGASRRAAALTHRLLTFSRRQTLDPRPTDVNRLVVGIEELIRGTAGPMIDIEVVGTDGLWPALVDPNQLENALLNLCINARDAMPEGGRITIETANCWLDEHSTAEPALPPGPYLSLSVTDTGTGMTPEVIARAFDPFFTTKPLGEGTGLGLSMIHGFADQSGGQVRILSALGQGSTVCLYLPRHIGAAGEAEAVAEIPGATDAAPGGTVLIVDDEPVVRMLVAEVLGDLGYQVIEAAAGAAGLELLRSDARIDLLITDVGLPGGMDGRQLAEAARTARPDLKVLFITGYAEPAAIGDGPLDAGMQVLTKPFPLDRLVSRIRELLDGR